MTYNIALNFEDGVTRFIGCRPGETVVDAAYRQSISIPMDCREGSCATCKCRVESGRYALGEYIEEALSQQEASSGFVLTCQMRPETDCVVLVPTASSACAMELDEYPTQIQALRQLSESTFELVLHGEALQSLAYLPGQYANLRVPGHEEQHRAYSFSAMAQGADRVSFLIRNVPGGLMSGFLKQRAEPGAAMTLTGPYGSFYLRAIERPVLMLAGGTGLAPFLAMLDKIAGDGGSPQPIHLIYGVNTDRDIVETERLDALVRRIPGFSYTVCVVDANSEQPRKGYVTHHIEPVHLHDGEVDIYLCGPPPMVEAVVQHLHEVGVQPVSLRFEKFSASIN